MQIAVIAQVKPPGVYVQEISTLPPSVTEVQTAIPVFIGYTAKADTRLPGDLLFVAKKINSFSDFEKYYGTGNALSVSKVVIDNAAKVMSAEVTRGQYLLYESMKLFFNAGGGNCYIISTGNYNSPLQKADLLKGLDIASKQDEITLLVFPDAVNLPGNDLYAVQQKALKQAGDMTDRFCILDLKFAGNPSLHQTVVNEFRSNIGLNNLKYGAAYTPHVKTTVTNQFTYRHWKDFLWKINTKINLSQLTADPIVLQKLAALEAAITSNDGTEQQKENELLSLFPAMKAITDKLGQATLVLPPSAAIAGVYCSVDRSRGVWKAPANVNINSISGVAYSINDTEQESLNIDVTAGKSVNTIRTFIGKGILVWGARTLAGNDNEWRYISVRRFFTTVEESVKKACQAFVFEPNDANTWKRIKGMIENYLTLKWKEGALMGATPYAAFFAQIGLGQTMTAQDILEGKLIVEIGMAAVRPAEFIILRFSMKMQGN
ncbi:MAG: phage tail sheath family protein [Chitinophagaceae bacterium]|nr:phage tail sheath family protein [Chitinophagaceae bacterium]